MMTANGFYNGTHNGTHNANDKAMVILNGPTKGLPITGKILNGVKYISATEMAKDSGKDLSHYWRSPQTIDFLRELSRSAKFADRELVITVRGGNDKLAQGTWVIEQVAHHLGIWLSAKYAVFVMDLLTALNNGELDVTPSGTAEILRRVSSLETMISSLPGVVAKALEPIITGQSSIYSRIGAVENAVKAGNGESQRSNDRVMESVTRLHERQSSQPLDVNTLAGAIAKAMHMAQGVNGNDALSDEDLAWDTYLNDHVSPSEYIIEKSIGKVPNVGNSHIRIKL